jgi:hypothetical protein
MIERSYDGRVVEIDKVSGGETLHISHNKASLKGAVIVLQLITDVERDLEEERRCMSKSTRFNSK